MNMRICALALMSALARVMIRRGALREGLLRGRPLLFDLYTVEGAPVRLDLVGEQP